MFDNQISTVTFKDTSYSTTTSLEVTLTIALDDINSIALFSLVGFSVRVQSISPSPSYDTTITLNGATEALFIDLPTLTNGDSIKITITASIGTFATCGYVVAGMLIEIGTMEYGATADIIDYSTKTTSVTGMTTFVRRGFSKRMNCRLMLTNSQINDIYIYLAAIRSTPCAWIGFPTDLDYAHLSIIGFYKSFSMEIAYTNHSFCTLEIEGLSQ